MTKKQFNLYAWIYLILNILVILDGAVVRATNSGAGCGPYWPLCQGNVLPNFHVLSTVIEFTHRISSGLIALGAIILVIGAFLAYPKKHPIRITSLIIFLLVLFESLLGAALVLFGLVESNTSVTRIWVMGFHLANTFLLLGAITVLLGWSSMSNRGLAAGTRKFALSIEAFVCLFCLFLTGIAGGITALGDTLFKPEYIGHNLLEDFTSSAHILKILRVFHPIFAIFSSVILIFVIIKQSQSRKNEKILSALIFVLIALQIIVGMLNLTFLTPIRLQVLHLFLADALWITTIFFFFVKLQPSLHRRD